MRDPRVSDQVRVVGGADPAAKLDRPAVFRHIQAKLLTKRLRGVHRLAPGHFELQRARAEPVHAESRHQRDPRDNAHRGDNPPLSIRQVHFGVSLSHGRPYGLGRGFLDFDRFMRRLFIWRVFNFLGSGPPCQHRECRGNRRHQEDSDNEYPGYLEVETRRLHHR